MTNNTVNIDNSSNNTTKKRCIIRCNNATCCKIMQSSDYFNNPANDINLTGEKWYRCAVAKCKLIFCNQQQCQDILTTHRNNCH